MQKEFDFYCENCNENENSKNPRQLYTGQGEKKILILGPEPSKKDDDLNIFHSSEHLQYFFTILEEFNVNVDIDCWYLPAIQCFPGRNKQPTTTAINTCRPRTLEIINQLKPKIIITLGDLPLKVLIGHRCTARISLSGSNKWTGFLIPDQELNCFIIPTFNPYYVLSPLYNRRKQLIKWNKYKPSKLPTWKNKQLKSNDDFIIRQLFLRQHLAKLNYKTTFYKHNLLSEAAVITNSNAAIEILKQFQKEKRISFDYETTGKKPHRDVHKILCIGISNGIVAYGMPIFYDNPIFMSELKRLLVNPFIKKIAHNLKFEEIWTRNILGYKVANWYWDTMVATHILDNRTGVTGLKFQTYVNFGIVGYDDEVEPFMRLKEGEEIYGDNGLNRLDEFDIEKICLYCAQDAHFTDHLASSQIPIFEADSHIMKGYQLFHQGTLDFTDIQENGFPIDELKLIKNDRDLETQIFKKIYAINNCKEALRWDEEEPFNFNSPKQLQHLLFDIHDYDSPKVTPSGDKSVDVEALKIINSPICKHIVEYRKLFKIKNSFLAGLKRETIDGILHPFFNLNRVATYRSSSNSINFQNLTKHNYIAKKYIRGCIKAPPGFRIVEFDQGQLEVRGSAAVSKDSSLQKYINDPSTDMHRDTAADYFLKDPSEIDKETERQIIKNKAVFPSFYGAVPKNIAPAVWKALNPKTKKHLKTKNVKNFDQFSAIVNMAWNNFWDVRFVQYKTWREFTWKQYLRRGKISLNTGFYYTAIGNKNQVLNAPIQGPCFHMVLYSIFIILDHLKQYNMESKIIGQVHDSIVMLVKDEEIEKLKPIVKNAMTIEVKKKWNWIDVPLVVEADIYKQGGSWDECECSIQL